MINKTLKLKEPSIVRVNNIVDMALDFSSMLRLFELGTKEKLRLHILEELPKIFDSSFEQQFKNIHSDFCKWGIEYITLAEKKKDGYIIKSNAPASYGQVAKVLNVVLKVVVYYCRMPEPNKAQLISTWLHAAVDSKMMKYIKPEYLSDWPTTIEQVDEDRYEMIQGAVLNFIEERHEGTILLVEFDDIYWEALNR